MKEYIVTLKSYDDLDSFYNEMETSGGCQCVPEREVECANRRLISRNTHYKLTDEEAEKLKLDERVSAVTLNPKDFGIKINPHWTQTGNFEKSNVIDSADKNWGLYSCTTKTPISNWGTNGSVTQTTQQISTNNNANNVDVVIVDSHINPNHPEFAKNAAGSGGSRVNLFNWFLYSGSLGISTGGSAYDYSDVSSNHGTHVAATACGNTQGWARKANIYSIEFDYQGTNFNGEDWALVIFDYLRYFNRNKPINPVTGRRNATITNHSWGYSYPSFQLSNTTSVTYRGTTTNLTGLTNQNKKIILENNGVPVPANTFLSDIPARYAPLEADIQDAIDEGVVIVSSAGNSFWNIDVSGGVDYNNSVVVGGSQYYHSRGSSPGADSSVICVGNIGTTTQAYKSVSSNYGPRVDVWAPGSNIISAVYDETAATEFGITLVNDLRDSIYKLGSITGTSMSSPQVTGIIALVCESWIRTTQSNAYNYIVNTSISGRIGSTAGNAGDYTSVGNSNDRFLYYSPSKKLTGIISYSESKYKTKLESKNVSVKYPRKNSIVFQKATGDPTAETYKMSQNKTVLLEGESVDFVITTTNVDDATILYYTITGVNVSTGDFIDGGGISGTVNINNNTGTFTKLITADSIVEGEEIFVISLRKTGPTGIIVCTSEQMKIIDPTPSYNIVPLSSEIDEGFTVTIGVFTTFVPDYTVLTYDIIGTPGLSGLDFTDNSLSGSLEIVGGFASFNKTATQDQITEGPESFVVRLRKDADIVSTSSPIIIRDTSIVPNLDIFVEPAVNGKSYWQFDIDGALILDGTDTQYDLTILRSRTIGIKMWGQGRSQSTGGYSAGSTQLIKGEKFKAVLGSGGGSAGSSYGWPSRESGGGYAGIFASTRPQAYNSSVNHIFNNTTDQHIVTDTSPDLSVQFMNPNSPDATPCGRPANGKYYQISFNEPYIDNSYSISILSFSQQAAGGATAGSFNVDGISNKTRFGFAIWFCRSRNGNSGNTYIRAFSFQTNGIKENTSSISQANAILIAGGAGGAGFGLGSSSGGNGGSQSGGSGSNSNDTQINSTGGTGGSQSSGGSGGNAGGQIGSALNGGNGGNGQLSGFPNAGGGGGGGGGYFGGGGGGGGNDFGNSTRNASGGGGGSGYVNISKIINGSTSQFTNSSDPNRGSAGGINGNARIVLFDNTPPTYYIFSNTSVNEGSQIIFSITTQRVSNGTTLYWESKSPTIGTSSNLTPFSGTVVITNNSGTITITAIADNLTENGTQTFYIDLFSAQNVYPRLASSELVTIFDTSKTPQPPPPPPPPACVVPTVTSTYGTGFTGYLYYNNGEKIAASNGDSRFISNTNALYTNASAPITTAGGVVTTYAALGSTIINHYVSVFARYPEAIGFDGWFYDFLNVTGYTSYTVLINSLNTAFYNPGGEWQQRQLKGGLNGNYDSCNVRRV